MKQNLSEQSKDYEAMERLEDLFDSAELQLQRTVTMLQIGVDVEQSFEGITSALKDIKEVVLSLQDKDVLFIASEQIKLLTDRMEEVIKQYKH